MKAGLLYRSTRRTKGFLIYLFLSLAAITCVLPLIWMFGTSLKTQEAVFSDKSIIPANPQWGNYKKAFIKAKFWIYLANSLLYTTVVVFGIVIVSSMAAYSFSRLKFPGSFLFFNMFLAAMMIPLPGSFVPLYVLFITIKKILLASLVSASPIFLKVMPEVYVSQFITFVDQQLYPRFAYIFCMINVGLSMSIFILKTFFDKMPKELEEAARIDGCSKIGIWRHVAMPLARPAIAVIVIYNTMNVWNEYILAQLILTSGNTMPLQRGLMVFRGEHLTQYPLLMAGLTMAALPILIVYLLMQKHIIKGMTAGAVVG